MKNEGSGAPFQRTVTVHPAIPNFTVSKARAQTENQHEPIPPMLPTLAALRDILDRHPPAPRYWIAYSGGLDSRVLLHLCAHLQMQRPAPQFAAVHVHHGLQIAAGDWAEQCRITCGETGIPFHLLHVDARPKPGQSPEEAARTQRYRALRDIVGPGETLLTAQHRDDQAETLLLQLLRGAGLAGLAAMPERAEFGGGFLLRPLLGFSRRELRDYADIHALAWVEDPSNRDVSYDRNFLRHQILPLLEQRWPAACETLSRAAGHCAEAQATLSSLARDLLVPALVPARNSLRGDRLLELPAADRRLVLREWLKAGGFRMPPTRILERVLNEVLTARPDRNPVVTWSEGEIRRYRGELYLLPRLPPFDGNRVLAWDGQTPLDLPDGNGMLRAGPVFGGGIAAEHWQGGNLTVRYRRGGESVPGRAGSRDLKNLFQAAGIPPWVRERVPLVYIGEELVAVGGKWIGAPFGAGPEAAGIGLDWLGPVPFPAS